VVSLSTSGDDMADENAQIMAVVVGKLEVMVQELLRLSLRFQDILDRHGKELTDAQSLVAGLEQRVKALEDDKARRPTWPTVIMVGIAIATLAVTLGLIGAQQ